MSEVAWEVGTVFPRDPDQTPSTMFCGSTTIHPHEMTFEIEIESPMCRYANPIFLNHILVSSSTTTSAFATFFFIYDSDSDVFLIIYLIHP